MTLMSYRGKVVPRHGLRFAASPHPARLEAEMVANSREDVQFRII